MDVLKPTCVDSVLEELNVYRHELGRERKWGEIRVKMRLLRTFLLLIPKWSDADEVVREHLGDLVDSIEAAFTDAGSDIRAAIQNGGDKDYLDAMHSKIDANFESFKPRIKETYDFLYEYAFRCRSPVTTDEYDWSSFCDSINWGDLVDGWYLINPLMEQALLAFSHIFVSIRLLLCYLRRGNDHSEGVWTHAGAVAVCTARLVHLGWIQRIDDNDHKMDDAANEEMNSITLSHFLHNRIKPMSPQLMDFYLKAIKSNTIHSTNFLVWRYVEIVLPELPLRKPIPLLGWVGDHEKEAFKSLREGLTMLIEFLLDVEPDGHDQAEDVEWVLISSHISKVISEAGSLNYSTTEASEFRLNVLQLLQKIEILKLEAVLMHLADRNLEQRLNFFHSRDLFESFKKGMAFLQHFLRLRAFTGKQKLIFTQIEDKVREAKSVFLTWGSDRLVSEDRVRGAHELLAHVRLLKIEAFLIELLSKYKSCSLSLDDQVEALHEGLEILRKFISGPPKDYPNDENQLILKHIEGVAKEAVSLCCSFNSNREHEHRFKELLSNLLEKVSPVKAKVKDIYLQIRSSSSLAFPKTQGLGFVDFFLGNLREVMEFKADSIDTVKHQITTVLKELDSLRSLLGGNEEKYKKDHPELQDLLRRVTSVAYQADYLIDLILNINDVDCFQLSWLSNVIDQTKAIKGQVIKIIETKEDCPGVQYANRIPGFIMSRTSSAEGEEILVALEDQERAIIDRLTRGSSRREVVSIVGMPGIGKTTLAKKVYDNPLVRNHFHNQAWSCISQVYRRRELLLKILSDFDKLTDEIQSKRDQDLLEILYRCLKGNRYLIVMDDIWGIQAWNDLGAAFPDDSNGSRILFTSRYEKVALAAQQDSIPHSLRFMSEDETWKLLQDKVFHEESCPEELSEVGKVIANNCKGLPLAVVATAGLLKRTEKKLDVWKKIAEDFNSQILEDPESQCLHILELSYHHLPDDLKPCFLYFAAFGEDREVPVQKLIWLWIAEGFITKVDQDQALKEDIAMDYLMDLIGRNLVMTSKKGSDGRVKTCQVHDVLLNLCSAKVMEENFLESITGYGKLFPSYTINLDYGVDSDYCCPSIAYNRHRLSICSKRNHFIMLKPSGPSVRSLMFFPINDKYSTCPYDISFISQNFKLLRVLDVLSINMGSSFASGIEFLDTLRYLAVSGDIDCIPSTISKLWRLEIFIVKGLKGKVAIPDTIWSMKRLRHLHVNSNATFILQDRSLETSSGLVNLVTLSSPIILHGDDTEKIMRKFPKLRKLRCTFSESSQQSGNCNRFPVLDYLTELESLKIFYHGGMLHSCEFNFPMNLKKLSLSDFILSWDSISDIGTLPKLEVLKLVSISFDSPTWEMREEEFRVLK